MMKCTVLLICVHLSIVLSLRDAHSHPLLFESEKDRVSTEYQSSGHSVKDDQRNIARKTERNLQDIGYATNCGKPDHNFTLTWKPKVINPARGVMLHLNMTVATRFMSGTFEWLLYISDIKQPFYNSTQPFNCSVVRVKYPQFKCPMEKGDVVNLSYTLPDVRVLPPGIYKVKFVIRNSKKEDFLCAEVNIEIKGTLD